VAVPLYGFVKGDTIGLLVVADEAETVQQLCQRLQEAADIRVAMFSPADIIHDGEVLSSTLTIGQSGLTALERIDVAPRNI